MAMTQPPIVIVGCGPGSPDLVTPAARQAGGAADVLVGFQRLLELFPGCGRERVVADANIEALLGRIDRLLQSKRRIVVLVSGDVGLYSLAHNIVRRFGRTECRLISGISSVQVAFARLGLDWADARIVSAHGRVPGATAGDLSEAAKIAVLCGTSQSLQWAAELAGELRASHIAFLCENLTMPEERVRQMTPVQLAGEKASSLAIVVVVRKDVLE